MAKLVSSFSPPHASLHVPLNCTLTASQAFISALLAAVACVEGNPFPPSATVKPAAAPTSPAYFGHKAGNYQPTTNANATKTTSDLHARVLNAARAVGEWVQNSALARWDNCMIFPCLIFFPFSVNINSKTQRTSKMGLGVVPIPIACTGYDSEECVVGDADMSLTFFFIFQGAGRADEGWPTRSQWVSFENMFNNNKNIMFGSCSTWGVPNDSGPEVVSRALFASANHNPNP